MKTILLGRLLSGAALACAIATVTPAFADAPPPPDYPPPATGGPWTGWYIGAHLGDAFDNRNLGFRDFSAQQNLSFTSDDEGDRFLGGVHTGYGWWSGNVYFGGEGDVSWADQTDYLASIRGRVGFGSDRWLVYGTAGVGFTGEKERFTVVSADDGPVSYKRGHDDTGFVGGGGVEYALNRNLSLGVEGLWYDFGGDRTNLTTPFNDDFSVRSDSNFGVLRGRLTWYLNN